MKPSLPSFLLLFYISLLCANFSNGKVVEEEMDVQTNHTVKKRWVSNLITFIGAAAGIVSAGIDISQLGRNKAESSEDSSEERRGNQGDGNTIVIVKDSSNVNIELAARQFGEPKKISERHYEVHADPELIQCTPKFCEKLQRLGEASFTKLCSAEFCHCDTGARAWLKTCGPGTVFNPIHLVCDWPRNVPGC